MRIARSAAVAAALALSSATATAHAWATAQIGDLSLALDGSGTQFGITYWNVLLEPHESVSRVFDYSLGVHTDGLPATRTWESVPFCEPLPEGKCGPDPTGRELVEADLETYQSSRSNPWVTFSGGLIDDVIHDAAGTRTESGSFTVTATNVGVSPEASVIALFASFWIDSNDVAVIAEPDGLALSLAGMSVVLAQLRRRKRSANAGRRAMTPPGHLTRPGDQRLER